MDKGVDAAWVVVAALLVMFMQAGFAMLEVGFSRMKNVGTVVAKVLTNFGVASIVYWAAGFGVAFGGAAAWLFPLIGGSGFAPSFSPGSTMNLPAMAASGAPAAAKFLFQLMFCAVSLAIVWGTMLERTKFIVHVLFAIPFAGFIYPLISHQLFGGGFLQTTLGAQDFAGSTVVHLTGAVAGLAGLLLLGPRIGKYERGRPNVIPGHSMPLAQLGVLILWFGWFGFNAGSTLNATGLHFADVAVTTQLAAAAGAVAALAVSYLTTRTLDVGMVGNGAIAALVGITAPSGYVEPWAAIVIGAVAGVIVVVAIPIIDRRLDDPVGCLSAHGLAGVWGTLACGLFTAPALARFNGVGRGGLFYTGSLHQLGAQAAAVAMSGGCVFALSYAAFWAIDRTVGLRVGAHEEVEGLDISEHGMWGYPESFMPVPGGVYRPASHPTVNREAPASPGSVEAQRDVEVEPA
jgi:Amt family ammonium transporter